MTTMLESSFKDQEIIIFTFLKPNQDRPSLLKDFGYKYNSFNHYIVYVDDVTELKVRPIISPLLRNNYKVVQDSSNFYPLEESNEVIVQSIPDSSIVLLKQR